MQHLAATASPQRRGGLTLRSVAFAYPAQIAGLPSKARILLAVFAGFVQEHNREGGDSTAAASREKRKKPGVHAGATTASLFSRYVQVCEQVCLKHVVCRVLSRRRAGAAY